MLHYITVNYTTLCFYFVYCELTCRAKEVLRDLKSVVKSTDAAESYAMGFGLGFRVMGVKAGKGTAFSSS